MAFDGGSSSLSFFLVLTFRLKRREENFCAALSFFGIEEKVSFISPSLSFSKTI